MLTTTLPIPQEESIAGFRSVLDPEAVLCACRERIDRVDQPTRDAWTCARMIEAMYHPGRYVRVVYALLSNPDTPPKRYWPEGELVYLHAPLREPMSRRGCAMTIDGTQVEAYRFPNDRRLRGLRKFAHRDTTAEVWQGWLDQLGAGVRLDPATLQRLLFRYVPEQKWIVRLRAQGSGGKAGAKKLRIAVRCASQERCASLLDRHRRLSTGLPTTGEVFQIPPVVGTSDDGHLLAVEWLRGETLVDTVRANGCDVLASLARRLGALHRTEVAGLPRVTNQDLVTRAELAVTDLQSACPELGPELRPLLRDLKVRLERISETSTATLHGDFHWNQVSIKRDRFVLLDLERMCVGDPWIDVATFASQLRALAYRPDIKVDHDDAELWRTSFLDAWERMTNESVPRERFAAYAALALLELARGMLRHLRIEWPMVLESCVRLAHLELLLDDDTRMST